MRSALPGPLHYFYADGGAARIWPQTPPWYMQTLGMSGVHRRRRGMRGMTGPDASMLPYTDDRGEIYWVRPVAPNAIEITAPNGSQQIQTVVSTPGTADKVVVTDTKSARPKWLVPALAVGALYAVM